MKSETLSAAHSVANPVLSPQDDPIGQIWSLGLGLLVKLPFLQSYRFSQVYVVEVVIPDSGQNFPSVQLTSRF